MEFTPLWGCLHRQTLLHCRGMHLGCEAAGRRLSCTVELLSISDIDLQLMPFTSWQAKLVAEYCDPLSGLQTELQFPFTYGDFKDLNKVILSYRLCFQVLDLNIEKRRILTLIGYNKQFTSTFLDTIRFKWMRRLNSVCMF